MTDVTRIISAIAQGDPVAAEQLLPLIYDELRQLAAAKLADERSGHSFHPTLLVHEAYVRLVDVDQLQQWNSRGHFFCAAAEAMRRILIEHARRKSSLKRGGRLQHIDLDVANPTYDQSHDELLALDEALSIFEKDWPEKANLVKLRYFGGLSISEASLAMGVSTATAERYWRFARAWLHSRLYPE